MLRDLKGCRLRPDRIQAHRQAGPQALRPHPAPNQQPPVRGGDRLCYPASDRDQVWLPEWLRWLDWLLWPLFGIIVFGAVFFGFSLVANLIAAPFHWPSRPGRGDAPAARVRARADRLAHRRCANSSRASARSFAA